MAAADRMSRMFNRGTSFESDALESAIKDYTGSGAVFVDINHPTVNEDGTVFKPYDTLGEGISAVSAGGVLSVVKGTYGGAVTIAASMEIEAPVGKVILDRITIASGATLTLRRGTYEFASNKGITVNAGGALVVEAGTTLLMNDGSDIFAYGLVTMDGTSADLITVKRASTARFDYLYLYGTGTNGSLLDYVVVDGANYGIHTNGIGSLTVSNTDVTDGYYDAIKFVSSSGVDVVASTFRNTVQHGAYVDGSDVVFRKTSRFESNGYDGIRILNMSDVDFGLYNERAENVVKYNGVVGIQVYGTSYVRIGEYYNGMEFYGYSSIYGNTSYAARVTGSSTLLAQITWWGSDPPNASEFYEESGSSIDYSSWLSQATVSKRADVLATVESQSASQLQSGSAPSLAEFVSQVRKMGRKSLLEARSYLEYAIPRLTGEYLDVANSMLVEHYVKTGDVSSGVDLGEEVLSNQSLNEFHRKYIAKVLFFTYLTDKSRQSDALRMMEILSVFDDPDVENDLISTVFRDVTGYTPEFQGDEWNQSSFTSAEAYPNPFNPTTTIQFTIENPGHVSIKVYNLLGQEVETLLNRQLRQGKHQVEFASNGLPSGVYLYEIRTEGDVYSSRIVLTK